MCFFITRTLFYLKKCYPIKIMLEPFLNYHRNLVLAREKAKFLENSNTVFGTVIQLLKEHGVHVWLDFGTLLGAYRDSDFIKNDFDMDFGVFSADYEMIKTIMQTNGFTPVREYFIVGHEFGRELTYRYKGVNFDFFFYYRKDESENLYTYSFRCPSNILLKKRIELPAIVAEIKTPCTGFVEMNFKNTLVQIPANTDEYLKANYGEGYRTPDPNFNYVTDSPNLTWFSQQEMLATCIIYN